MGRGENAVNQHFVLFQQCFQKLFQDCQFFFRQKIIYNLPLNFYMYCNHISIWFWSNINIRLQMV